MSIVPDSSTSRLGEISGGIVAILSAVYVAVLGIGLFALPSSDHQIEQPWFFIMETLILLIAPAMAVLAVTIHAWSSPERKTQALVGVAFFVMCALVTCALHFSILALSRQTTCVGVPWSTFIFAFRWPSLAYALDILAWDFFFPIGAVFLAYAMSIPNFAGPARGLMFLSAVLAFVGLLGVPMAEMQIRNIGIIGYAVVFPISAALLAVTFHRARNAGVT